MLINLLLWLLKKTTIKLETRNKILNALLEKVNALPFRNVIIFDNKGTLIVDGKPISIEQARVIKEGAHTLVRNPARRLIREQLGYKAVEMGVHSAINVDMMHFSKAVLWLQQEEDKLLEELGEGIVDE